MTPVFNVLASKPNVVSDEHMEEIERYVVLLYSRTSSASSVNEARKVLFAQSSRTIKNIPPTQAALRQHVKRAAYQAGYVWGQCLLAEQVLPSPAEWGWKLDTDGDRWVPVWSTLPEVSKSCAELIHCGCRKSCTGPCRCFKANLPCTGLCVCGGHCHQQD